MSRPRFRVALAAALLLAPSASPVRAGPTDDDRAREIYGQLIKAKKARDLDGVMKLMEVPFWDSNHEIIKDVKVLREGWKQLLADVKDPSEVKPNIKEVVSYPKFRERYRSEPDAVKLLDRMKLGSHDRVVLEPLVGFVVRIRNGRARIVGMLE